MRSTRSNQFIARSAAVAGFLLAWLFIVWVVTATGARAHEFYSEECCDEYDCRPAAEGDVTEGPDGYEIRSMKMIIPYGDKRVHIAPDNQFHICPFSSYTTGVGTILSTRCLYVPPRAF